MNSALNPNDQSLTLVLPGDLVSTNAAVLRGEISDVIDPPSDPPQQWNTLRLDLSAASMVDSVGLGLIVALLKNVQKRGCKLQVLYASQNVFRAFSFTRLDKHIELLKA